MCGIVGAVATTDIAQSLIDCLKRLEYRGYDSAGLAVVDENASLQRLRCEGKVDALQQQFTQTPIAGLAGIAHTRWATHGKPCERNAHPHISDGFAIVHNGIIENHVALRADLKKSGYTFTSDTDSEIIAHLLHQTMKSTLDLREALQSVVTHLRGAFAIGVIHQAEPQRLVGLRCGSPMVVGLAEDALYLSSDHLALLPLTQQFIYLEEGDVVDLSPSSYQVFDFNGHAVTRDVRKSTLESTQVDLGDYQHFMRKEISEQPQVLAEALEGRISQTAVLPGILGPDADVVLKNIQRVHIVACGTSYYSGVLARYWMEKFSKLPTQVEIASEFRYRDVAVEENTLLVTISQSGETADTLAALRYAKSIGYAATLTVCNVPESSLVRESDFVLMTRAGCEIGVASTKAFTTQLVCLMLLTLSLGQVDAEVMQQIVTDLHDLPRVVNQFLALEKDIQMLAEQFVDKEHALFLGRGEYFPIALEGALKLKELSYLHAEAYPAGELKHGPLALVDENMPIVAIAPNDRLQEKLLSNLHEVKARGGQLFIFADAAVPREEDSHTQWLVMPAAASVIAPIAHVIPLQLLAYHVALLKGNNVDQPRNLAKSVTVE